MKKPNLILTADWHLRDDQPICRTDDYFAAQNKKISFIMELQEKHNCDILIAGDLFHKAKSSKSLEIYCLKVLCNYIFGIPGNHDLPNHSIEKINESSIGILRAGGLINLYDCPLDHFRGFYANDRKIGMIHSLVHRTDPIKADGKIISQAAKKLLKDNPEYDLIVSGDNHQTFVEEYQGRLLVNPGSLMRMSADQIVHKPCVFLYYSDNNSVEQVFIPIEKDVVDRSHIDNKQETESRFNSFITRMNEDFELSLSFEKNISAYLKTNKTRKTVEETIWEHLQ